MNGARLLAGLLPQTRGKILRCMEQCAERGVQLVVTDGARSRAEQAALYAVGRNEKGETVGPVKTNAKPGQSFHQCSRAADLALDADPGPGAKPEWPAADARWAVLDEEAVRAGLRRGPAWDKPHVEDRWCASCKREHNAADRKKMAVATLAETFAEDGTCARRIA